MSIKLKGSSDGSVSFDAPADTSPSGSDITLVLPTTVGSAEQFLKNSGTAGTLEFSSMVETSTGVGIGTSSPSAKLHANSGTTDVVADFESGDANAWIQIRDNSTTDTAVMVGAVGDDMRLRAGSNERVRIDNSGNVGIGTTSPSGLLSVHQSTSSTANYINITNDATGASSWSNGMLLGNNTSGDALCWQNESRSLLFGTNNNERMRIDNDGRLLLGLTSSIGGDAIFQVQGSGNRKAHFHQPDSGGSIIQFTNTTTGTGTSDGFEIALNGSEDGQIWLYESGNIKFGTNNAERMRIQSDGRIKVSNDTSDSEFYGTTMLSHLIHNSRNNSEALVIEHSGNTDPYGITIDFTYDNPDDNSNYFFNCKDSSTNRLIIYSDGDVKNHDNSYGSLSDQKLKQDIVDAGSQWDDIKELRVRKFKFKTDVAAYGDDAKTLIGLVAQEAELVSPGLVRNDPDLDDQNNDLGTVTKSISYSVLYMKAVKALQEAMDRIETLEAKVAALEAQ